MRVRAWMRIWLGVYVKEEVDENGTGCGNAETNVEKVKDAVVTQTRKNEQE
jgi:hypothetical protein